MSCGTKWNLFLTKIKISRIREWKEFAQCPTWEWIRISYCPVEMKKSKPEGLARIQAGGKRSATPAIRYITEKAQNGRQNPPAMLHLSQVLSPLRGLGCSRSSMQGLYPCLWSVSPSGFIGVNQTVRKDSPRSSEWYAGTQIRFFRSIRWYKKDCAV